MKKQPPVTAPAPKQAAPPAKTAGAGAGPTQADTSKTADGQDPAAAAPDVEGKDFSEVPAKAANTGAAIRPFKIDPALLPPAVPGLPDYRFKLSTDPASLIDWSSMRQPFLSRGLPLTGIDADMIGQNWIFSYNQMVGWGLSGTIAAKIANLGTPLAYNFSLSRDYPTTEERFDRELEKTLAPGKSLGKFVVPIITPDTLNWAVKQISGKDIDFRF